MIPSFTVNDREAGDTAFLNQDGNAIVAFNVQWTFPLQFAEIISGDGSNVFRHTINLDTTLPFGKQTFKVPLILAGRKWVRLELWDVAVNGAFTQTVLLK